MSADIVHLLSVFADTADVIDQLADLIHAETREESDPWRAATLATTEERVREAWVALQHGVSNARDLLPPPPSPAPTPADLAALVPIGSYLGSPVVASPVPPLIPCEDCDNTGRIMVADGSLVHCSCPAGSLSWAELKARG